MCPFVVLGVCARADQRISLSALVRNPHKGPNGEIFRETGSGREKEGPREERESVDKGKQRETSRQRKAEETSRREIAVQGKDGQQKASVKDELAFLEVFVEVSCKIHACDSLQMHGKCKVSLVELTQVRVCSFVLFLPPSQLYFVWP